MKKFLFTILFITGVFSVWGQAEKSAYLFRDFQNAFIFYKDGRQFNVPLNYNLLTHQYEFIDKKDADRKKEFTEPNMIISIEIGNKTFLPPSEGVTEIIQREPLFYVEYQASSKRGGASVGYGGTTETASSGNYSGMRGNFIVGGIEADNKSVTRINKIYKIKVGKKMKTFFEKKKFLKLFTTHKEKLNKYIEENKINFDDIVQVMKLYNYALSLN